MMLLIYYILLVFGIGMVADGLARISFYPARALKCLDDVVFGAILIASSLILIVLCP